MIRVIELVSHIIVIAIFVIALQILFGVPIALIVFLVKKFSTPTSPEVIERRRLRRIEKEQTRLKRKEERKILRQQKAAERERRKAERKRQAEIRRANRPAVIIQRVDMMSGVEFENFVANIFRRLGYSVRTTAITGDFGADLILSAKGDKICVQCKRYAKAVNLKAVQEITSAKTYYDCNKAMVVTNSHYTQSAYELARSNGVTLLDREWLYNQIQKQTI